MFHFEQEAAKAAKRTLKQSGSIVQRLVRHQFVSGTDTPRVCQHVQVWNVSAAVIPNHPLS